MSRAATGDTVVVKPARNVYTALLGAAIVVVGLGLVVIFMRASALGINFFAL